MAECGCTCTPNPDEVKDLVRSYLYSEISAGNLQAPLLASDGSKLGAAVVLTKSEVQSAIGDLRTQLQSQIDDLLKESETQRDALGGKLDSVNHDGSLDGAGTSASPLTVDAGWLKSSVANILGLDGGVTAAVTTENGTIPTTMIGGTDAVLGKPDGFIPHPTLTGYGIPVFATKRR